MWIAAVGHLFPVQQAIAISVREKGIRSGGDQKLLSIGSQVIVCVGVTWVQTQSRFNAIIQEVVVCVGVPGPQAVRRALFDVTQAIAIRVRRVVVLIQWEVGRAALQLFQQGETVTVVVNRQVCRRCIAPLLACRRRGCRRRWVIGVGWVRAVDGDLLAVEDAVAVGVFTEWVGAVLVDLLAVPKAVPVCVHCGRVGANVVFDDVVEPVLI